MPVLDAMLKEQNEQGVKWTCSSVIKRLGLEINHEDSIFYWGEERYPVGYCPRADGRFDRRHVVFPLVQESGFDD